MNLVDVAGFGLFLERFKFSGVSTDSFLVHVVGKSWVSTLEVFSEDLNEVFVHFAKLFFPLWKWKEEFHLDLGSGFGKFLDHFVDTSFGLVL